jgi:small conductance mechanosensitive channel
MDILLSKLNQIPDLIITVVDIQMRVWCKPEHYWDVMFDLTKSVKEAFDKGGISIPYPHGVEILRK